MLLVGAPLSIREIDFRNRAYPFVQSDGVPEALHWMDAHQSSIITLEDGRYRFGDEPQLILDRVTFGKLRGVAGEVAAVTMTYPAGGTATWQYGYLFRWRLDQPSLLGWFETGSRAYSGLNRLYFEAGNLVIDLTDPERVEALCCSSGFVRKRYQWTGGKFQHAGRSEFGDLR